MIVKFKNWENYNKRSKEYKHPIWFSFTNDFATNKNFHSFSDKERLIFVYLLCEASKENKNGTLILDFSHFSYITKQDKKSVLITIEKLKDKHIVEVPDRAGIVPGSCDDPIKALTDRQTEQTDSAFARDFDFEEVYKKYPKKVGKADGISTLIKTIKSEEDFGKLERAVANYAADCAKKGIEPRFIRMFSSFIGTIEKPHWRDWADYEEPGKASKSKIVKDLPSEYK